jgi:hypothetical protein
VAHVERRALIDQLHELVAWLETGEQERPELFGTRDEYEWLLRLTTLVLSLIAQHQFDAKCRCLWCHKPRTGWHRWLPRWRQRLSCEVLPVAKFIARAEAEVAWWQAFCLRGDDVSLDQVRAWLYPDDQPTEKWPAAAAADDRSRHALLTDGRVRLRDEPPPDAQADAGGLSVRPYARPARLRTPGDRSAEVPTEELPKIT